MLRRRHLVVIVPDPQDNDMESNEMAFTAIAQVPTTSGSRYLQQLCKHWQHNMPVAFTPEQGTVKFARDARGADWPGDGLVTMIAHTDTLECRIDATAAGQRDGLKGALARHLDRFAFREAPLTFEWVDS
jgi:hypothetical protein